MRVSTFFAVMAAAVSTGGGGVGALAATTQCIDQAKAIDVVQKFSTLLAHANATQTRQIANALLADDFKDYSDSILALEGQPLGQATFTSKQDFLNRALSQPPITNITNLYVGVTNCTSVIWFWRFGGIGNNQYPIRGFDLFRLNTTGFVYRVAVEFNSLSWARDEGFQVVPPPSSSSAASSTTTSRVATTTKMVTTTTGKVVTTTTKA